MEQHTRPKHLSAAFVKHVKKPGKYTDGPRSGGLSLLVKESPLGGVSKSFMQRLAVDGRRRSIGLGPVHLVSLAKARDKALANARAAYQGVDPLAERHHSVPTFREAAERAIAQNAASWKNDKSEKLWRGRLGLYAFPVIGSKRVDKVTAADVLACVAPIWSEKRETARKVRQYVSGVMGYSIGQGWRSDNPAAGEVINGALPRTGRQVEHFKALPFAELPGALEKVRASGARHLTIAAIEFLVLTCARSGEIRGATWDEIDAATATWTVSAERMKTGKAHRVPLSGAAMDVLTEAARYADGHTSGLMFPSTRGKQMSDVTVSKLFRELSIQGTPHGCRATFRTWAAEAGIDWQLAEFALAHVVGSAAVQAYQRSDLFEDRRGLMEQWAVACQG